MITIGRIKTVLVKRVAKQLVAEHKDEFTEDFTKNKEILVKYAKISSPKLRNVIAGYVSRLTKQAKEGKVKRRTSTEDISKFYLDDLAIIYGVHNKVSDYFRQKIINITDSGMSNEGFTMNLNATRKIDSTRSKIRVNPIDNLKGGKKRR